MDQRQTSSDVSHIIQVYQPAVTMSNNSDIQSPHLSNISHTLQSSVKDHYEQAITPDPTPLDGQLQSQIVMSCQQTHLQNTQPLQSQVLQGTDINQSIQFTSVLLPQVPMFKQQTALIVDGHHYYGQYEYVKECVVTKLEPDVQILEKEQEEHKAVVMKQNDEPLAKKKRTRSVVANPNSWACNVRKLKHQRGEAYISRRGKYVPERTVKNVQECLTTCKYKCNNVISDTDRQNIFKAFYSLNVNEKKHFLLNTTERHFAKRSKLGDNQKRKYTYKYFFLVRAVRHMVCKNFYLGTLAISQKPIYNVHMGKSEMNTPKPDGRGLSIFSPHGLPADIKDKVRKHIMSFKTEESKPVVQYSRKKQYLDPSLTVRKMYTMYFNECTKDNVTPVKESMYRKIFKKEFNLHFIRVKTEQQRCCKCKGPVKKK